MISVAYQLSLIVKILLTALYLDIEDAHDCVTLEGAEVCYYTQGRTFGEGENFCKTKGGHLSSIASPAEQTAVHNLINSVSGGADYTWIGYIDVEATGTSWNWIDGRGGYTNWDTVNNEPNNPSSQLCAAMNKSHNNLPRGKWHNGPCEQKFSIVCRSVSYSIVLI